MSIRRWTAAVAMLGLAWSTTPAAAAVTSAFTTDSQSRGVLRIESDADDAIHVTCVAGFATVNGGPPDIGAVSCGRINRYEVSGGPGPNRIDLSSTAPTEPGTSKGVNSSTLLEGRAGDDTIFGPREGYVHFVGGAGNDWLQGQAGSLDQYSFGPAETPERDTIAEPTVAPCQPSYFESDQPDESWWTVPWDALDFETLRTGDGVSFDRRAPNGVLADHRNRTILAAQASFGLAFEAIRGGAGDDRIAGGCMVLGGEGNDTLTGIDAEGDLLMGGPGHDILSGRAGADKLDGGTGHDDLHGENDADALYGGAGNDVVEGGPGSDVYVFRPAGDQAELLEEHGRGFDTLSFDFPKTLPVRVDLAGGTSLIATARNFRLRATTAAARAIEGVIGGRASDRFAGHAGANLFMTGGGSDIAIGRGGNDVYRLDWVGTMPYGAYSWFEYWGGPFPRSEFGRARGAGAGPTRLRILEVANGGRDTLDLSSGGLDNDLIQRGVRVDLSAPLWMVRTRMVAALAAQPGGSRFVEAVRGSTYADRITGNAADNVLDGRGGRDRVSGGRGRDRCPRTKGDVVSGCERR